jgi:hypothetical protein
VTVTQSRGTYREVTVSKPDVRIKNKKEKTYILIDVAIQADRNVTQKEAEKKPKYKSLCTEIEGMGNNKCMIIPAVIGVTGMEGLKKNLEAMPGKHSIDSLRKAAVLGTSHVMGKVLQCEPCGLSGGDRCWVKRRTREKWPVTKRRRQRQHNNNIIIIK